MCGGKEVCLGEVLRAAVVELYRRRFEASPNLGVISAETGISLDALRKAWEIVRTDNNEQSRGEYASV